MATATRQITIGPADHGRTMSFDDFTEADFQEGWLYELARGMIDVAEVPDLVHGRAISRIVRLLLRYENAHPGIIDYQSGGACCRVRLPGMQSSRRPDQAVYLFPPPTGDNPWTRWTSQILVEVVSEGGEARDYIEKREEYLRAGVSEYWILDPKLRRLLVLSRAGDVWEETVVAAGGVYRTHLLPGPEVNPEGVLGPAEGI